MASFLRKSGKSNGEKKERLSAVELVDGRLNVEQQAAVDELRRACSGELEASSPFPEVVGDRRLLRFLRGHKFDLKVAAEMYGNMLRWRREQGIDKIRNDIVDNNLQPCDFPHAGRVLRYYPSHKHHGFDRAGRPLQIDLVGKIDPRKLLSCFDEDEFVTYHIYACEYLSLLLERLSVERNSLLRISLVCDLTGLGAGHLRGCGVGLLRRMLKVTQDNYPESMDKCFLVNSPKAFTIIWAMIAPLLAERTVKKVQVLGGSYQKKLLEAIAPEHLPVSLGGTREDEWPLVFDKGDFQDIDSEYKTLELAKASKRELQFAISEPSFVVWGFFTKAGTISATVRFTPSGEGAAEEHKVGEERAVLAQVDKAECRGGSFEVASPGVVEFELDNNSAGSSWLGSSSTVSYYVCAVPLEEKHKLDSPRRGKLRPFFSESESEAAATTKSL